MGRLGSFPSPLLMRERIEDMFKVRPLIGTTVCTPEKMTYGTGGYCPKKFFYSITTSTPNKWNTGEVQISGTLAPPHPKARELYIEESSQLRNEGRTTNYSYRKIEVVSRILETQRSEAFTFDGRLKLARKHWS
jgi:hypothetical protein